MFFNPEGTMAKSTLRLLLTLALSAGPTTALADPILQVRCTTDGIDRTSALQRIEWARRCGLLTNTGGPNSADPTREYTEINHDRAYSSSGNGFAVNFTYVQCRYGSGFGISIFQETSGPTAGFWKWTRSVELSRPLYPIFETTPVVGGGTQLLPLPSLPNDCNLYQKDPVTGTLSPTAGNFYVVGYCVSQ
jgi:hypothetical protein